MAKQFRFYKVDEKVWVKTKNTVGSVHSLDVPNKEVTVSVGEEKITLKFWEIDKLKFFGNENTNEVEVFVSKVKENAIIPSKRDEDAGYDLYACLEEQTTTTGEVFYSIVCPRLQSTLVPTGIAMALPKTHYLNTKHERGSTGKHSMSVLSGVVDSGYRGEIFVNITPLNKDITITSLVDEVKVTPTMIYYPYSKAICQGTIELVPQVKISEIPYEELVSIKSERGTTKLGESGK